MDMPIHAAGCHESPARVDGLAAVVQILAQGNDYAVADTNVRGEEIGCGRDARIAHDGIEGLIAIT
jgi:hypothetical protein